MPPSLTFTSSLDGIGSEMLTGGFFDGWVAAPTPEEHLALLRGSSHVAIAVDRGAVVGFANAISDGVLSAYIPLPEVLPAYRGNGVGSRLVRQLLDDLAHLYMVDVMCDEDVLPFYEALGLERAHGAVRRNRAWRDASERPVLPST